MLALGLVGVLSRLIAPRGPTEIIECRVDAGDPFASSRGARLNVRLAAWQEEDGAFHATRLILERPGVGFPFCLVWRRALRDKAVFRARVGPITQEEWSFPKARLVHVLGPSKDAAFARRSRDLVEPADIHDPQFGTFKAHPRIARWHRGEIDWLGHPIGITLDLRDNASEEGLQACLDQLRRMTENARPWTQSALEKAAERLYPTWVEADWSGDDPVLPVETWRERLSLKVISLTPAGDIEFEFDDGDLFWGHWVVVDADFDGTFLDARMEG